jgi:hypothetical protein
LVDFYWEAGFLSKEKTVIPQDLIKSARLFNFGNRLLCDVSSHIPGSICLYQTGLRQAEWKFGPNIPVAELADRELGLG